MCHVSVPSRNVPGGMSFLSRRRTTNDVCRHVSGRVSVSVPKSAVRDGSWVFFVHCGLSIIWRQQLLHTPSP